MSDLLQVLEISMTQDMHRLNSIAHNLANATTAAFKRDIGFAQALDAVDKDPVVATPTRGVIDFSPGALHQTGNPLHVAIEGDGFFAVQTSAGETLYTRNGQWRLDAQGRLVTGEGYSVLDQSGAAIHLSQHHPHIDKQGRIWENGQPIAQLQLSHFHGNEGLAPLGSHVYRAGQRPQQTPDTAQTIVRQAYLEASNVQTQDEMVRLIETMRHFEMSQRAASSYDEVVARAVRTLAEF